MQRSIQMNENIKETQEMDFFDIFRALLKKWKLILCITLAALLAGGCFGAVSAVIANNKYGTKAEFYIYSDKANAYILSLVQSDSFAESLLLNEYGLPDEYKNAKEYTPLLEAKKEIIALDEKLDELERDFEIKNYAFDVTQAQKKYNDKQTIYNEIYNMLVMYKSADAESVTDKDAHNKTIAELEESLKTARADRDDAKELYDEALLKKQQAEKEISDTEVALKNAKEDIKEPLNKFLDKFRNKAENEKKLELIKNSVTYSYAESEDTASQALLYVNIAVPDDPKFAQFILDAIIEKLPDYVEKETLASQDSSCEFISTFSSVKKLNSKNIITSAIVSSVITAVVACVVVCGIVVSVASFKRRKQEEAAR